MLALLHQIMLHLKLAVKVLVGILMTQNICRDQLLLLLIVVPLSA